MSPIDVAVVIVAAPAVIFSACAIFYWLITPIEAPALKPGSQKEA